MSPSYLMTKISAVYKRAYPCNNKTIFSRDFIKIYLSESEKFSLLQRETIISYLYLLEVCQQYPELNISDELNFTDITKPRPQQINRIRKSKRVADEDSMKFSISLPTDDLIGKRIKNELPRQRRTQQIASRRRWQQSPGMLSRPAMRRFAIKGKKN